MFTVWRRKFDELLSYSQFWLRYGCRAWDISDVCGRGCDDSSWSACVYIRTSNMCVLHNVCTIYICKGAIEVIFKCLKVSCQIDTNTYIRYIYTYNIIIMYLYTYKCILMLHDTPMFRLQAIHHYLRLFLKKNRPKVVPSSIPTRMAQKKSPETRWDVLKNEGLKLARCKHVARR